MVHSLEQAMVLDSPLLPSPRHQLQTIVEFLLTQEFQNPLRSGGDMVEIVGC
jgi:hypothetical protein